MKVTIKLEFKNVTLEMSLDEAEELAKILEKITGKEKEKVYIPWVTRPWYDDPWRRWYINCDTNKTDATNEIKCYSLSLKEGSNG